MIALQTLLFLQTIHHRFCTCADKHEPKPDESPSSPSPISPRQQHDERITHFMIFQAVGLFWTLCEFIRMVIDPVTFIISPNILCTVFVYISEMMPLIYFAIFQWQIMIRLEASLVGTFLAIPKCQMYIYVATLSILLVVPIEFIFDHRGGGVCHQMYSGDTLQFCAFGRETYVMIICGFIAVFNMGFALFLCSKLRTILIANPESQHLTFGFKAIVVNRCLLSIIGSTLVTAAWILWLFTEIVMLIHLEVVIGSAVIGGMVSWNNKCYRKRCKYCIMGILLRCDRSESRVEAHDLNDYCDGKIEDILTLNEVRLPTPNMTRSTITSTSRLCSQCIESSTRANNVVPEDSC